MIRRAMPLEIDKSSCAALAVLIEWLSHGTQISIGGAKHVDLLKCLDEWDRLTAQTLALAGFLPVTHAYLEAILSGGNPETSASVEARILPLAA